MLITFLAADGFEMLWFWTIIGCIFIVERIVTVRRPGLARRTAGHPARHRNLLRRPPPGGLREIADRHRHGSRVRLEHCRTRDGPAMIPLGVLLPSSVLQSGWFQTLAMFVAIDTLIYAALASASSSPAAEPELTSVLRIEIAATARPISESSNHLFGMNACQTHTRRSAAERHRWRPRLRWRPRSPRTTRSSNGNRNSATRYLARVRRAT